MSTRIVGRKLVTDDGPLGGAAAVRGPAGAFADPPIFDPIALANHNESVREHRRCRVSRCPICKTPLDVAPLPTVADVENDGDRGPRPSRDPLASIDATADAQRAAHVGALLSAVAGLHVDEVRVLAAMARQLPGVRLRAACEAATAQGWVRSGAKRVEVPTSPLARAQSSLLGTWREWIALILGARSTAAGEVAQRDRGDVLADELARRVAGEPGGGK